MHRAIAFTSRGAQAKLFRRRPLEMGTRRPECAVTITVIYTHTRHCHPLRTDVTSILHVGAGDAFCLIRLRGSCRRMSQTVALIVAVVVPTQAGAKILLRRHVALVE